MSEHPLRRRLLAAAAAIVAAVAGSVAIAAPASAWVPKTPRLSTPWTSQVPLNNPLPEYPRPQLVRSEWQSLNGIWQFGSAANLNTPPLTNGLSEEIRVPYPIESALSGIQRRENFAWYRRTFTVPTAWAGRRVQLNFDAVMWEARVWVNGTQVGKHTGGYDAFSFDITAALRSGQNTVVVGIHNPVDAADIPIGKQRLNPGGIWYTPYSGIWQTVWLEPTNAARITRLDTTPNVAAGALDLAVQTTGAAGRQVRAEVLTGGQVVGQATGAVGTSLRVPVPDARLWTPDDPFLYDLRVTLLGSAGDTVTGYFGMRSLGKAMLGGVLRPTLNGAFVFQLGTLDQGYWPDGISTAPTDAALRFDLEQQKAMGFNMVRKHIKVESARWFYWADRLGLMVWQDMPALPNGRDANATGRAVYESELRRMIDGHKGITSIVQWVPFNEGWGEFDAGRIADLVKRLDPTRLVNHNSGSNCCESDPDPGNGDVIDDHMYVGPGMTRPPTSSRIAVLGEYGGLGLHTAGHEWNSGSSFAYEMLPDPDALTSRYVQITGQLVGLISTKGVSGSVYTEPTDVENEINGFMTYDRQVRKMDFNRVREVNLRVLGAARGTTLPVGQLASLRVTSPNYTDRYLRHRDGAARTDVITAGSSATDKQDASFWVRPGLSSPACYSFESRNFPGRYLRHRGYRIYSEVPDIAADATFCTREGLSGGGTSLEAANLPGRFLRHRNEEVWVDSDTGGSFRDDATWNVTAPLWRSGADLPVGQARSFRVVTPNYTDRYLRHRDGAARTDVITAASPAADRQDATFIVRTGLADNTCYSFESRNFPGRYLRHRNFRVYNEQNDNSSLYAQDATFCAQPGRSAGAGNVSLASVNIAGGFIRHYNEEVWVATNGGGHPYDSPNSFDADVTWNNAAPWS
jgi:Alpha-L-arabinofuranosidase B (ABFB) domain/Glycosyl hydrolases family 2, sugar binding domain/Glycosyl hydrolases family 2